MSFGESRPARKSRAANALFSIGLAAIGLLLMATSTAPCWAHHRGVAHAGPVQGLAIPNLSHGQMAVIAANRAAILELAARQSPTDPMMTRLEGYINLQSFACMWGLVPGTLDDEASPFNECAHAYLSGTRALLLHLLTMPGDRAQVRALVDKIELEMLSNGASLVLCRYSDEAFDTADIVGPR